MSTLARYPHLAARVFNTPLMVSPQKIDAIIAGLGQRLLGGDAQIEGLTDPAYATNPAMFSTRRGSMAEQRGYRITDGVAVVNMGGLLVHRSRFVMADSSFILGYNDLAADIEDAMDNDDVHAVLLVTDSPGGEVSGAFELAQRIFDLRGKKPLWAVADTLAASAAYLAASAVDQLAVAPVTGVVGSIGVLTRHADFSRAFNMEGIKVTSIFAGAHKVDGNPYEPLPRDVQDSIQEEINDIYGQLVGAVASHGRLDAKAIRATEAATFRADAAVTARLADRVATTDQLITELAANRSRTYPVGQPAQATSAITGETMADPIKAGQPSATATNPAATAPTAPAATGYTAEQLQAAITAERERGAAIMALDEAKGRQAMAQQCVSMGLTVDQSKVLLAAAPSAQASTEAKGPTEFEKHMALVNPSVSGIEPKATDTTDSDPAALAASWDRVFGVAAVKH